MTYPARKVAGMSLISMCLGRACYARSDFTESFPESGGASVDDQDIRETSPGDR